MSPQQQMYEFVSGLIRLVTDTSGLWFIAGPFVVMGVILRIIIWAVRSAKGESLADMQSERTELDAGYRRAGGELGYHVRRIRDSSRRPR